MRIDFSRFTTEELDRMHKEAEARLKRALLDGVPFDEIRQSEEMVTQLAITIHYRRYPLVSRISEERLIRRS